MVEELEDRVNHVGKKGGVAHHVRQVETEGTEGDDCKLLVARS